MFTTINKVCVKNNIWNKIKWDLNKISNTSYSYNNINPSRRNKKIISAPMAYNVIPQPRKTVSEDERRKYAALFPTIIKDLTEPYPEVPEVIERYISVLQYNVPNHKQASGLAVLGAFKAYASPEDLTPKNIQIANILGWCVDLTLCSYQINDDIMDGSETRRGLPCWYKNPGVGGQAINDAVLIENAPFILLKKYLSDHHAYSACVEWLHEANIKTALGQSLDTMNRLNGKPNLDVFTPNRCKMLAKYKGTYPEFMLPMKFVLYLAGRYDNTSHEELEIILCEMGDYLTAQNDILDCYGDPLITGKVGSDIREGKCTWLVMTALQRASKSQRQLLKEHYGNAGPESELIIRTLYNELGILDAFLMYEEESYNTVRKHIGQMTSVPQDFFFKFVDSTYGRYEQHES